MERDRGTPLVEQTVALEGGVPRPQAPGATTWARELTDRRRGRAASASGRAGLVIAVAEIECSARNRRRRSLIPRYDRQRQERIFTPRER
jgi:hypothetical protein